MIVVQNKSGLGNRLKNIITALRKADRNDDALFINFPYESLFSINYQSDPLKTKKEVEVCTTWSLRLFKDELEGQYLKEPNIIKIYHDDSKILELKNSIDFQYLNIHDSIIKKIAPYFHKIEFTPLIKDTVESYAERFDLKNVIGIHIRSWSDDVGRHRRLHDIKLFTDKMKELPDQRFFVATDSLLVLAELVTMFPNQIIASPAFSERHVSKNPDLATMFSALIDMLLLARCEKIIGTYSSTFTEVAWWFGGCRDSIDIPVPECCK